MMSFCLKAYGSIRKQVADHQGRHNDLPAHGPEPAQWCIADIMVTLCRFNAQQTIVPPGRFNVDTVLVWRATSTIVCCAHHRLREVGPLLSDSPVLILCLPHPIVPHKMNKPLCHRGSPIENAPLRKDLFWAGTICRFCQCLSRQN